MVFTATLGGLKKVKVLLDSGAAGNFITRHAARSTPAPIKRLQNRTVHGAGGDVSVLGRCSPRLQIQGYRGSPVLYVLDKLPGDFDVVLGNPWLKDEVAVMSYGQHEVVLTKSKPHIHLDTLADPDDSDVPLTVNMHLDGDDAEEEDDGQPDFPQGTNRFKAKLLTALTFSRIVRKVVRTFAVMVVPVPPEAKEAAKEDTGDKPEAVIPRNVQRVIDKYKVVFKDLPMGLPPDRGISHTIPLVQGAIAPHKRMYRLSPLEKKEVETQVKDLLARGWIVPSTSPYGAPVIFAQKKDGTLRMCVDYRALNKLTIKNRYPLPRIDDLLDRLHGATVFSSLDLQAGYHQILITPEDSEKTAFLTHQGLYQYKVLCFGVSNAPSTFQAVMNAALAPVLGKSAMVYMDDILVFSKTQAEHAGHLEEVLKLLKQHQLYAKMSKCSFAQPQTNFLGHVISADGISVDPRKIAILKKWPRPTSADQVRSFLGLATYFRKFCKHFSTKAHWLHQTLKKPLKGKAAIFVWGPRQETAFRRIKYALTHAPTLKPPNLDEGAPPFHVVCDASGVGLGGILIQDGHPVAYESRKMLPAEKNYGVGEQELLAVVHAMRTWRCYLEGVKSVVVTDHNPNTYLQTQPMLSRRQVRWSEYLQNFDFEWLYKPGPQNPADPLSRMPQFMLMALTKFQYPRRVMDTQGLQLWAVTRAARVQALAGSTPAPRPTPAPVPRPRAAKRARANPLVQPPGEGSEYLEPPRTALREETLLELCRLGYDKDPWFRVPGNTEVLKLIDGLYRSDGKVVVPGVGTLRQDILEEEHDCPFSGHIGAQRTYEKVNRLFWWPSLRAEVTNFVASCHTCQRNKGGTRAPAG